MKHPLTFLRVRCDELFCERRLVQRAVRAMQIDSKPAEQLAHPHAAAARLRHFHVGAAVTSCRFVGYDLASRRQNAVPPAQVVTYKQ
jgi:hypothetical protein